MKKIIFFTGTMRFGGAERVISILANYFAKSGYEVEILQYYKSECVYEITPKVHIVMVQAETESSSVIRNLLWIRRHVRDTAEVVVSFMASFNMLMIVSAFGLGLTLIVADRNDPNYTPAKKRMRKLRDFLYEFSDGVVLQTSKNQQYFSKRIQRKSTVIYNPICLGDRTGLALRTQKRKEIVSVGRLIPVKNQEMLIDAFAAIRSDYPEYELTIYGEGSLKAELEAKCNRMGIGAYVHFPGNVEDIYDRIAKADIFVLTSNFEGMPNALAEAMCLGLPVVSTKVSGSTDLISEKNGCLIDIGNRKQLEEAIRALIEDSKWKRTMALEAVKLSDRLSVEKIADCWTEFISQRYLLKNRKSM